MKKELVENMIYAMETRQSLINKYDPSNSLTEVINENKWIQHIFSKLDSGWIPDYGEVALEVEKTISFGLFLRRTNKVESHPSVTSIDYSKDSTVINVNFRK